MILPKVIKVTEIYMIENIYSNGMDKNWQTNTELSLKNYSSMVNIIEPKF